MSIASLVFTQSPSKTPPAKRMALQCFQTSPHINVFIAIWLTVSKAPKKFPKISLIPPAPVQAVLPY